MDPQALDGLRAAANEAGAAWATLPDRGLRHDFGFTARLIAFAADKVLTAQAVQRALQALGDPTQADGAALARLDAEIDALEEARRRVPALRTEFETCWLRLARPSEIGFMLEHFDVLARSYDDALAWLTQQRTHYVGGQAVDAELSSYTPRPFAPLWEKGMAELHKLADLAGIEALPPEVRAWLTSGA
jgi:hypothetical protein